MKTKLTALARSDQLKVAIVLLAIAFLVYDAFESRSAGSLGWIFFCIYWSLPEKTKTTPKDVV